MSLTEMQEETLSFLKELSKSCSHGSIHGNDCLSKIYTNVISMLGCRGYTNIIAKCATVDDILNNVKNCEAIVVGTGAKLKKDVHIFFYRENKVGIKFLRTILEKQKNTIVCVVSIEGPTTFTKRDARDNQQRVQFATFKQLFNNISTHTMIPPHRLLSKEEQQSVREKYSIHSDSQWPKLLEKDPVSIFYHFQKGDLIEIQRKGIGGQEATMYYRMVT